MSQIEQRKNALRINVENVLKDKNPSLHKRLPKFFVKFLEKLVHQEEINAFLEKNDDKFGIDFLNEALDYMNLSIEVHGFENVDSSKNYTFVSNHPLGGLDGMALMRVLSRKYKRWKSYSNDILMNVENLKEFFVPVNKHGAMARDGADQMEASYLSDAQMIVFPAGLVSRRKNGIIRDLEWKKTFISKTIQYKRDVIPVHISGRNSNTFYRVAAIRNFLGIKANLEMLLLANEMFLYKNKSIIITFGEPIPYQSFDRSKRPLEWAQIVKETVYQLGNK